jgi:NitT/TauT family transport system substrate-binding protein
MSTREIASHSAPEFAVRSIAGIGTFIVAGLLALAACAPPLPASKPSVDVRVGLFPATTLAPILVPTDEGEFAARGLNVSIQTVADNTQALVAVATGNLDIGNVSLGPATLNALNGGSDLRIIAANAAFPPGHGAPLPVVVRSDLIASGVVTSVADLKGRKIAIPAVAAGGEYVLMKALTTANLAMTDVSVMQLGAPEMVAALTTGAVDAAIIPQPVATQAVAKGAGKILIDDYSPNQQVAFLVTTARFLDTHRDAVTSFLEVYIGATRRLSGGKLKTDQQALAIMEKYANTPAEVIRLAPDPYWPNDGRVLVDSLRDEQAFFIANGNVDYAQPMDVERVIDYGPLDAALKNLGG